MALTWGAVANDYGRAGIDLTTTSTATELKASIKVYIWTKYSVSDASNVTRFHFDSESSTSVTNKSIKTTSNSGGWSTTNRICIYAVTRTFKKGKSASKHTANATISGIDRVGRDMSVSVSFTVPAKTSYNVTYSANGGKSPPGTQTKWHGEDLTLSSGKPSREGYEFVRWNTKSDGSGTSWTPSQKYTANAGLSLYAIWKAITYSYVFDAREGRNGPRTRVKTYGTLFYIPSVTPVQDGYIFAGWSCSNGKTYQIGDAVSDNGNLVFTALWNVAYKLPEISLIETNRCTEAGQVDNTEGIYAKMDITFLEGTSDIRSVSYVINGQAKGSAELDISQEQETVSVMFENVTFPVDSTYALEVVLVDSEGRKSATYATEIRSAEIFAHYCENGFAFGGKSHPDTFSVEWKNTYVNDLEVRGATKIGDRTLDEYIEDIMSYHSGDKLVIGDGKTNGPRLIVAGQLTSNKTEIMMSLLLQRSIARISSARIVSLKVNIRTSTGGYASSSDFVEGGVEMVGNADIRTYSYQSNVLNITLNKSDGWGSSLVNNTPVAIEINSIQIEFE